METVHEVELPSYGKVKIRLREPSFGEIAPILGEFLVIDLSTGEMARREVNMIDIARRLWRVVYAGSEPEIAELADLDKLPVRDALVLVRLVVEKGPLASLS